MINERGNAVCDSCGVEYEYFSSPMLKDEIWKSISNEYVDENGKWHGQMFCKDCIEKKLRRKIVIEDLSQYVDTSVQRKHNQIFKGNLIKKEKMK